VKILIAVAIAARMSFSFLHGKLEKLNQRNASAAINDGPGQQVKRRGTEEKGRKNEIVETNQKRCNQAKGCYSSRHTHKVRRLSLSFSLPTWMWVESAVHFQLCWRLRWQLSSYELLRFLSAIRRQNSL